MEDSKKQPKRMTLDHLAGMMTRRFDGVDKRLDAVDARLGSVEGRLSAVEHTVGEVREIVGNLEEGEVLDLQKRVQTLERSVKALAKAG